MSNIIGSGNTLERNLLFRSSSKKTRMQIFSPKVFKVYYFSGLGSCYVVGKPSDERECSDECHIQI